MTRVYTLVSNHASQTRLLSKLYRCEHSLYIMQITTISNDNKC